MTDTKKLYSKGFLVRVKTWENDADNYNTEEIQAETEEKARAIVELCKLFARSDDYKNRLCNLYSPNKQERQRVYDALRQFHDSHPDFFDETPDNPDYITDWYIDYLYDLGVTSGEFFTRVVDKIEVLEFKEDIFCHPRDFS